MTVKVYVLFLRNGMFGCGDHSKAMSCKQFFRTCSEYDLGGFRTTLKF